MDLNWNRHPSGSPITRTFTPTQIRWIRRKVAWWNRIAGGVVVEWGGEWPTNPASHAPTDGMHWQLARGRVAVLARLLWWTTAGREVRKANPGLKL